MTEKLGRIKVQVKISAQLFRRFAMFDAFIRCRRWQPPTLFAAIFMAFAAVAFLMRGRSAQAPLLAAVLLAAGVVLPMVYLASYQLSVRAQIQKMKLDRPRTAYTLTLGPEGLEVNTAKAVQTYAWGDMHAAYRRRQCTYLYISPKQAYLLPHEQLTEGPDALWTLLTQQMPPETLHS